ncbi:MAG: hypothetical protein JWQ47_201 [Glaciihabitans sp.]|nr:hypothetical protein [Glaciihabitans sp.]
MDEQTVLFLEVMAGFVVIIILGIIGWTTRRRRQRSIPSPETLPADIGAVHGEFEGFYVSTTLDGQPLNRVAVRGLGFRARATFAVADRGVVLALPGNNVFIPREAIREVTRAQYTIDRVVEPGGLVLIAWTLGDPSGEHTDVDSYLRIDETQKLVDLIASVIPKKSTNSVPSTGTVKTGDNS